MQEFLNDSKNKQRQILDKLSDIAKKSPQNAYCCMTRGIQHKINFIARTTPNSIELFDGVENTIRNQFLPNLLEREINDIDRSIFALPVRQGGLNILLPSDRENDYTWSKQVTQPLNEFDPIYAELVQQGVVNNIKTLKNRKSIEKRAEIATKLSPTEYAALERASEKGASSWLNTLPLSDYKFDLNKRDFRDAIHLRYNWEPKGLPLKCSCQNDFSLTHALHCPNGGYTIVRHNAIRDVFADLMKKVCKDVSLEPKLLPLDGETFQKKTTTTDDDARLDIKANGLWGTAFERTFFDVKVFNPMAKSCPKTIKDSYRYHEGFKLAKYEDRIKNVDHSEFVPLVFACSGGCGPLANKVIKRLALRISEKTNESYSQTMNYIRTKIGFALIKSTILCLRGCRTQSREKPETENSISAIVKEAQII